MRLLSVFLTTFFIVFFAKAQDNQFIKVADQINAFAVSQNESFMVYAVKNNLYKADVQTMKVIDSFPIPVSDGNYIDNIKILSNNSTLLLQQRPYKEKRWGTYDFQEYPQDSIHVFDLTQKKITGSVSGNVHFEYLTNQDDHTLISVNDYFSYIDQADGSTAYSPRVGFIMTYPSEKKIENSGIVRAICKHPEKNEIVIAYYNYENESKTNQYALEIRNSISLEVIKHRKFSGVIKRIIPSKDGKLWQIIIEEDINKFKTVLVDYETLEEKTIIDSSIEFSGWITDNKVFNLKSESEITIHDLKTLKQTEEIWVQLTPFSNIAGIYALNSTELLIFGNDKYKIKEFNNSNGVQKFSLKQEEIYTKKSNVAEKTKWFEPDIAFLSTNTFKEKYDNIRFYNDWILVDHESAVEFWNITKQKKWRTFSFAKKTKTFFSEEKMTLLVLEESKGKEYSDFILRLVDLKTGETKSKLYSDNPHPFLSPSCNCKPIKNSTEWLCTELGGIWKINADDLSINLVQTYTEEKNPDQILFADKDKALLKMSKEGEKGRGWGSTKTESLGYYWLDLHTKEDKKIIDSELWSNIHYLGNNTLLFVQNNIFYLKKEAHTQKLAELDKNSRNIFLCDSGIWFEDTKLKHIDLTGKVIETNFDKVIRYNGYGVASQNSVFLTTDNIFTYHIKDNYFDTWKTSKAANIFYPESELLYNPKGYILWKNSLLLDLNSLSSNQKYDVFSGAYLFKKEPYVVYKKHYQPTNKFHLFIESIEQNSKLIWRSAPLDDIDFSTTNYIFSDSEEQLIGFKYGKYSLDSTDKFIWIDWKKDKTSIITCKDPILLIVKTDNPEVVEVIYNIENPKFDTVTGKWDKKNDFFNIITGEWNKNFKEVISTKTKPVINFDMVTYNNKDYYAREYLESIHFSEKHQKIIAGSQNGQIFVWDINSSSPFKIINTGATKAILHIIETADQIIALDQDGFIHFLETPSFTWTTTVATQSHGKKYSALWYTPEGFYSADKNTLRDFHFIKQDKMIPLNIFDAYLNRPEKILEKLTKPNNKLLDLYKEATAKRMRKLGISENTDFWNIERPIVTFSESYNPAAVTNEVKIEVPISFSTSSETIEVYNNGILIESKKALNTGNHISEIKLHSGENNINITVSDKNKIQSEPLAFKITNTELVEPKVYYIGIGVSEYQDATMNLKFAVKDVEKIEDFFKERYKDKIEIHKLLNQEVTINNIQKIKEILEKTNVNDKVVISFSGHGLINSKKEFYFAGYDTDFSAPEKLGIPFELIQSLTENIPARKRLILLDACHSGSIDEEQDFEVINHKNVTEHNIKGSIVVKGKKEPLESFEQMQNMFFDFNKSDGTIVIAASGAKEYAYEGEDWNNGVFTYSFINSMRELGYDTYSGKRGIPISELQKSIYQKVIFFTKGKQKPTSRTENIEWDWEL